MSMLRMEHVQVMFANSQMSFRPEDSHAGLPKRYYAADMSTENSAWQSTMPPAVCQPCFQKH
eukprot:274114-Chlamydomonas_euryale.AAC.1